mgnify:CR=1 FL=1
MPTKSLLQRIKTELRFARYMTGTNLESAMELRTSFFLQVFGMMLNNTAHLSLWIYFFHVFGSINGWTSVEVIGLQGILAFVFGIGMSFANGVSHLPEYVDRGVFDQFLLSPRNLYIRIMMNRMGVSSLGDILFGVLLIMLYLVMASATLAQVLILLSLLPAVVCLFINYLFVINLIGSLIPDATSLVKNLFMLQLAPATYPYGLFQGFSRVFFIFIVPGLTTAGLPIDIVRSFHLREYAIVWGVSIVWTILAWFLLKKAVRRYESGNLTGARI